jgi:hypothetical protein
LWIEIKPKFLLLILLDHYHVELLGLPFVEPKKNTYVKTWEPIEQPNKRPFSVSSVREQICAPYFRFDKGRFITLLSNTPGLCIAKMHTSVQTKYNVPKKRNTKILKNRMKS